MAAAENIRLDAYGQLRRTRPISENATLMSHAEQRVAFLPSQYNFVQKVNYFFAFNYSDTEPTHFLFFFIRNTQPVPRNEKTMYHSSRN